MCPASSDSNPGPAGEEVSMGPTSPLRGAKFDQKGDDDADTNEVSKPSLSVVGSMYSYIIAITKIAIAIQKRCCILICGGGFVFVNDGRSIDVVGLKIQ